MRTVATATFRPSRDDRRDRHGAPEPFELVAVTANAKLDSRGSNAADRALERLESGAPAVYGPPTLGVEEVDRAAPTGLPVPGDVLAGKYRIERVLGRGGMGIVYAAAHVLLGQRVAVKMLRSEAAQRPEALQRFLNEARAAARIESDHVARVMDIGTSDAGTPYMVLEYLDGSDLAQLARGARLDRGLVVDYVLQALEGIAQAHALGIVHRDLKPANLFLARRTDGTGRIKVLDFGISKTDGLALAPSTITSASAVLGSPFYISPEQLRSAKQVDARADVWALGVILYELFSGRMPFVGDTLGELFTAILEQAPLPLRAIAPDVPAGLEAVVQTCLARPASRRYANVAELAEALAAFGSAAGIASAARTRATLAAVRGGLVGGIAKAASADSNASPAAGEPREGMGATITATPVRIELPIAPIAPIAPGAQTSASWGEASRAGRPRTPRFLIGSMAIVGFAIAAGMLLARSPRTRDTASAPTVSRVALTGSVFAMAPDAATDSPSAPPVVDARSTSTEVDAGRPKLPTPSRAPSPIRAAAPALPSAAPASSAPPKATYDPLRDSRR